MSKSEIISTEEYETKIKFLSQFFSPSKIYPYSNYVTMVAKKDRIEIKLPLIIGEAISTGGMSININTVVDEEFSIVVPCKDLLDAFKVVKGHGITFEYTGTYLGINTPTQALKVPLATETESIPALILSDLELMRQQETVPFDIQGLNDIMKVLGREIKAQTTNYSYHGVYVTEDNSYVTNGMTITKMDKGLGMDNFYIPFFSTKLFKALDLVDLEIGRLDKRDNKSPYIYFKGDGIDFYLQEWMSKDVYPITQIEQLYQLPTVELPVFEMASAFNDVMTLSKEIVIDFPAGLVYDRQGRVTVKIPQQEIPKLIFMSELMPNKASYKNLEDIHLIPLGEGNYQLKFFMGETTKIISSAAEL